MQSTRTGRHLARVHAEWDRATWKWEGNAYGIGKEIKLAGIGWGQFGEPVCGEEYKEGEKMQLHDNRKGRY